jgi:hypothetical protein
VFDPASIQKYSVILIHYAYPGETPGQKYFVVLSHEKASSKTCVLCLKATGNTAKYKNDQEQMNGCVFYEAGQLVFFSRDTAVQPDNPLGLTYEYIVGEEHRGRFKVVGKMPPDFKDRLCAAIQASKTIPSNRKDFLLEKL